MAFEPDNRATALHNLNHAPMDPPIPEQPKPDDRAVRTWPIKDNGESLVPASLAPECILTQPRYYLEKLPGALAECFVRESVWERLLQAADALPSGHRLVLFDAWRPVGLQHWLFEQCVDEFSRDGGGNAYERAASFVSRPLADTHTSPPFHLTGGAVDLSIADAAGRLLDMGTPFDAMTGASFTDHFEHVTDDDERGARVRANRRLLYHAMTGAGFVNLPSEWWHYGYGDQLWAWAGDEPHAIYGETRPAFRWGSPG